MVEPAQLVFDDVLAGNNSRAALRPAAWQRQRSSLRREVRLEAREGQVVANLSGCINMRIPCAMLVLYAVHACARHSCFVFTFGGIPKLLAGSINHRSPVVLLGDGAGRRAAQLPEVPHLRLVHGPQSTPRFSRRSVHSPFGLDAWRIYP